LFILNQPKSKRRTLRSSFILFKYNIIGKVKNPTGSTIKGHENTQKNADLAKPLPTNIEQIEFASPSSTISLPNYQPKVSSVFDATHGLPPPTSNAYATSTGPIVKPKSNHSFGAIR
jgi:hypothetical protein